jgi:hypothetical protein
MAGEEIRIGPFVGGLNTLSDPTSIADNELTELINFELDIDGSLVNRPPLTPVGATMLSGATGNMKILGYFVTGTGTPYLIGSDGLSSTYYFDGTSWALITSNFAAAALCQFRDKAWLLSPIGSPNPGGYWQPVGGFVADANLPHGACIIECKERLWVGLGKSAGTNGTRLYMSDIVAAAPSWPATPMYVNVGSGDGQNIVDLTLYFSDIVIFKQGSTYRYSYSSDPAAGSVTRVSATVGAADTGCFTEYEGQLYVLYDNKVYLFVNYNYDRLNVKVPLSADNPSVLLSEYSSISTWSDRLFVAFYDKTYVYSLRTRTWSTWKSSAVVNIGRMWKIPGQQANMPTAYTYSTTPRSFVLYKVVDQIGILTEAMSCSFRTKNFDFQSPGKFKRLFGWDADIIARQTVSAVISPVNYAIGITWDQLAAYTWDQIATAGGTWDRPLDVSLDVSDTVSVAGLTGGRKFVKFMKSLRFRQIAFKLTLTTDGSSNTAPVRVFSLVTYVKDKQKMVKRIS